MQKKFISFEGGEGSGKTTTAKGLFEYLVNEDIPAVFTRDPGGTKIGDRIRDILLPTEYSEIAATTEFLLYQASRAQLLSEIIKPALEQDKVVITDRFIDSTVAYQGWGRGHPLATQKQLETMGLVDEIPGLTFLLQVDPKVGLTRSLQRQQDSDINEDRFEKESMDFHKRVYDGYTYLAKRNPSRIVTLDTTYLTQLQVFNQIKSIFLTMYWGETDSGKGS